MAHRIVLFYNGQICCGSEDNYHHYFCDEVDAVDLRVAEYDHNQIPVNIYVLETLLMPEAPTEIPDAEAKTSVRTKKSKLFGGACEVGSVFAWQKRESRWKRKSSSVILDLKKAPAGSRLAMGHSVMIEAAKIEASSSEILHLNIQVKYAAENSAASRKCIADLEAEILNEKKRLAAAETIIQESDSNMESLRTNLKSLRTNLKNAQEALGAILGL